MRRRTLISALAVPLLTAGLMVGAATPAFAADPAPAPAPLATASAQMVSGGFRADVADANGYQIITNPDGSEASVPITEAAIAQQAAADEAKASYAAQTTAGGVVTQGSVDGDCGSSWIEAVKQDNDVLAFTTGYVVFGAVVDSQWLVVADAVLVGNSVTLYPGPNSGTWQTEGALGNVVGPGFATVDPFSSFAVLASGQVCYSGAPSASFG